VKDVNAEAMYFMVDLLVEVHWRKCKVLD